jgi:hypothetical protein
VKHSQAPPPTVGFAVFWTRKMFQKIVSGRGWPAFGFIAAEADLRLP